MECAKRVENGFRKSLEGEQVVRVIGKIKVDWGDTGFEKEIVECPVAKEIFNEPKNEQITKPS